MNNYIAVNTPLLNGNEKKYLNECIDTGWISSEGQFVARLEDQLSQKTNRQFGIAVCNGTAALELAVQALEIGENDEVILPTFTIISCVLAIIRAKATPVLVDSDPITWNMNISEIEAKITPRTKAIMVVHIYGLPVDMQPLLALAKKYKLKIIEDAAQMLGQTYYGVPCGSFGEISTLSFYPNKLVTTGEGGMVLTNEESIAQRCTMLRNLAFSLKNRYCHDAIGWNFRMSNLQAAVGVAQYEKWEAYLAIKRNMGHFYTESLADCTQLQLPLVRTEYANNLYWVYGIIVRSQQPISEIMAALHQQGIGTRAFFCPMHKQPVLKKMGYFMGESYPVAEYLSERGFYIPSGLALKEQEMRRVVTALRKVLQS